MGDKAYYLFTKGLPKEKIWERLLLKAAPKPNHRRMLEQFVGSLPAEADFVDLDKLRKFQASYFRAASEYNLFDGGALGGRLVSGWYQIQFARHATKIFDDVSCLEQLSHSCEVILCDVYENTNDSTASYWANGKEIWHVSHSLNLGREHVLSRGITPEVLQVIIANAVRECENSEEPFDYFFQVPLRLVAEYTGWEHARGPDFDGEKDYLQFKTNHPRPRAQQL